MTSAPSPRYTGRFAPSPTGPLHFGSLIAALASYLDARAHGGRWLVRIEDVDQTRTVSGAADAIIDCLDAHGLSADESIQFQSDRHQRYSEAAQGLVASGQAFFCTCSRSDLAPFGQRYPGTCRGRIHVPSQPYTIRMKVNDEPVNFVDGVQGLFDQRLAGTVGDFVIWRKEGFAAYHLAVVLDDASQAVTDVVRGADLLDNTPRQIWLQRCLGLPEPRYAHLPVIANAAGQKLSKQTFAKPLDPAEAAFNLRAALAFLGQPRPHSSNLTTLLASAVKAWRLDQVPRQRALAGAQLPADCRAFAT